MRAFADDAGADCGACGVGLKLHAEKKPNFEREVALV